jgi:hypothetical protein
MFAEGAMVRDSRGDKVDLIYSSENPHGTPLKEKKCPNSNVRA